MANKRVQFRIDLQIEAMFDPSKLTDLEQVKQTAIGLALNPNYHTIDNGVQLTRTDYVYIAD